jgi:hypothetical protein
MYIADSGKQYVNQILKQLGSTVDPLLVAPVFAKTPTVKPLAQPLTKAPATETMSKAEWSAKDRSQLIGGLSHDAATLAASIVPMSPYTTVEEVLAKYKFFLEGMLKIRDEVR